MAPERESKALVTADGRFALVYCSHDRFGVLLDMHMEVLAAAFEAVADQCKALAIRFIQAVLKGERGEMMAKEESSALLN